MQLLLCTSLLFATATADVSLSGVLELRVDCATSSLHAARDTLRAAFADTDASGASRPRARVLVTGPCHLSRPLAFDARDSGDVTWAPAPPARSFLVSGGAPVAAASFVPVTDAAVLAQLPAAARAAVRQLNLSALALPAGPAPIAGRECRVFAEGLPQPHAGNMPTTGENSPQGLELFAAVGAGGATVPLSLARWPNAPWLPANWSRVAHSSPPTVRTFGPDPVTLARSAAWVQQFEQDPGSIFVHQYNRVGWADMHWRLEGLTRSNLTFGGCGNMSVGEHVLETGNYFYTYNVASELDTPGEFYVNRTSNMLYAWLPADSAPDANGTLAWASLLEAPLLDLNGVAGATWTGADFRYGRGVGVSARDCSGVSLLGCSVSNVGLMGVNVSGGVNVLLRNLTVSATGSGGVYLYAGDRVTLTPANHTLLDSRVTAYNRVTHCYTPGVVLGGVGNSVLNTRIWDAPHNAIFLSGNEHTIDGCDVSAVVRIVSDSGAFYAGRDLTYRGNRLLNTAWHDINSVNPGVPALYLDDARAASRSSTTRSATSLALLPRWKAAKGTASSATTSTKTLGLCTPWARAARARSRTSRSFRGTLQPCGSRPTQSSSPSLHSPTNLGIFTLPTTRGCGVTDADLRNTTDALVARGLAKAGYTIVAPDDCWARSRDADGRIVPDPVAFPNGMLAVAEYVRSRGLEFGIYTAIGNETCAHRPGSAGHEADDAASYASWGVTWAKIDNCNYPGWDPADLYETWAAALDAQAYRIPVATKAVVNYSIALRVAASRRVGGDVSASWRDLLGLAYMAEPLFAQARPGSAALGISSFWTDVELLQVGNGHLSDDERDAHFWLWAALHAPLMLSTKISELSDADVALLTNPEVLAVNADALGAQARRVALQVAAAPALPLAPAPIACSTTPALVAPGQRWDAVPAGAAAFSMRLRADSGPAAGLCLQRPACVGGALVVDVCPAPGAGCDGGDGALWEWGAAGALVSRATGGGCVSMEPAVTVAACRAGAPYQALTYVAGTGQLAMNFTGSGAAGDYTGYAQCIDALPATHAEVWASPLANGDVLLLALNPTNASVAVVVDAAAAAAALGRPKPLAGVRALRDIGARANVSAPLELVFNVSTPAHGARILRLTPT